jgi:hypothetical protein
VAGAAQRCGEVRRKAPTSQRRLAAPHDRERRTAEQAEISDCRQNRRCVGDGGQPGRVERIAPHHEAAAQGRQGLFLMLHHGVGNGGERGAGGAGRAEMGERFVKGYGPDAGRARQPQARTSFPGIEFELRRTVEHAQNISACYLDVKQPGIAISAAWD